MEPDQQTPNDGCCGGGIGPVPYPNCRDCPRIKQAAPPLDSAKAFTRAEMRGVQRLADRIKFDLFVVPVTQQTTTWRRHQEIALAVILERIKDGR